MLKTCVDMKLPFSLCSNKTFILDQKMLNLNAEGISLEYLKEIMQKLVK